MRTLKNANKIDNSPGIGQNIPNKAMNATEQSKETPWFLRFTESFDTKSIVQIAGIGTLYGILFAGLLLMPLSRHLEMQANVRPD